MTRKGLIAVEQMPLLLNTATSQELLFKAVLVVFVLIADKGVFVPFSGKIDSENPSNTGNIWWHFIIIAAV